MATTTTNYGLSKPAVNDPTDQDLWGGELNTDLDSIDTLLKTAMNFTPSSQSSTITVTAPTAGSTTTGSARILYLCNAAGGAFNANLPAAATASGVMVAFKKTDSGSNAITIQANAAELIDGTNTQTLSSQYDWIILSCDGTGWNILGRSLSVTGFAPLNSPTFTGTPAGPTPANGTNTTQLATTAFAYGTFNNGSTGYQKFASGFILQWGTVSASTAQSTQTVSLPLTFPNACLGALSSLHRASDTGGDIGYNTIVSVSTTQIVFLFTDSRYWLAWGY